MNDIGAGTQQSAKGFIIETTQPRAEIGVLMCGVTNSYHGLGQCSCRARLRFEPRSAIMPLCLTLRRRATSIQRGQSTFLKIVTLLRR